MEEHMNKKKIVGIAVLVVISAMVLLAIATVGCSASAPEAPDAASITYDGSTIKWDAVESATGYVIKINGGESIETTINSLPHKATDEDESVSISIWTVGKKGAKSEAAATRSFARLATIETVTFNDDGVMSWNAVEGASAYIVEVNGVEREPVSALEFSDFEYGQVNSIRIRPAGDAETTFSSWSTTMSKTFLTAPGGIAYDGEKLTWGAVSGASGYKIYINGAEIATAPTNVYTYNAERTSFNVAIKALGDADGTNKNVFPSRLGEKSDFVYMDRITDIRVENGIVEWNEVENAVSYELVVNGSKQTVTTNKYEGLTAGKENRIKIKPVAANVAGYFSEWSDEQTIFLLNSPVIRWNDALSLDGETANSVYWDAVTGHTASYEVRVVHPNGEVTTEIYGATQTYFGYDYLAVGEYEVSVKAVADRSQNAYDSPYSEPIKVIRLSAPSPSNKDYITSDPTDQSKGFTVRFNAVPGATSYQLYRDGVIMEGYVSTEPTFSVAQVVEENLTDAQTINYSVRSIGSIRNDAGQKTVTLSSLTQDSMSFEIRVLAVPRNLSVAGFTLGWDHSANAEEYTLQCGATLTCKTNSCDLSMLAAGGYEASVCARGNGEAVLASRYTAPISIVRLDAPGNIRIGTEGISEGVLTWDEVAKAQSYQVYFNNDDQPIPANSVDNINKYITTDAVSVRMVAVANSYSEADGVYYLTSLPSQTKQFIKLQAVTFTRPSFSGTEMRWNVPSNINTDVYTPSYIVYDTNGFAFNGQINGTTMDLSSLESGTHQFTIKCIGDGVNYINSDMSDPVSITKLDTPVVRAEDNAYKWSGVSGANGYVVKIDGEQVKKIDHTGTGEYSYKPTFDQQKEYYVEVIAVGDGGYSSIDSSPWVIKQTTKKLTTPTIQFSYSEESYSSTGEIIVRVKPMTYATGYVFTVGGVTSGVITETEYRCNPQSTGIFSIEVYAVGGGFDNTGVCYINSAAAGGGSTCEITLLGAPNVGNIVGNRDGKFTWDPVPNNNGYELILTYDDGSSETVIVDKSKGPTYTVARLSELVEIQIRTLGNGKTTITSEYVKKAY